MSRDRHAALLALTITMLLSAAAVPGAVPGAVAAAGSADAGHAVPVMMVPQTSMDAGGVVQGEVLSLEYTIRNQGEAPLTIDARPSCGCTVAEYDHTIAPGAEGRLTARINTAGFSGPITKSVLLRTNDPETPTLSLTARLDVHPVLELVPRPMLRLGTGDGAAATGSVVLQATGEAAQDFTVTGLEPAQPYVKATARRLGADGASGPARYEITVSLAEDAPKGFLNVPVTIHTDYPKAAAVQLRVVGTVVDS